MAENCSAYQAALAVTRCLAHVSVLVKARNGLPWQTRVDTERVASIVAERVPKLKNEYDLFLPIYRTARKQLFAARKGMIDKGIAVRQDVVSAFGTKAAFALDIANEKLGQYYRVAKRVLSVSDDPQLQLSLLNDLDDPDSQEWRDFLAVLELEATDVEASASQPAAHAKGSETPPLDKPEQREGNGTDTLRRVNDSAAACVERANGFLAAVNLFDPLTSTEVQASARLKDMKINVAELLSKTSELARLIADTSAVERFRQSRYDLRRELPLSLRGHRSVHEAALSLAGSVAGTAHNAMLAKGTALERWHSLVSAIRQLPALDTLTALDNEYRHAVELAHPKDDKTGSETPPAASAATSKGFQEADFTDAASAKKWLESQVKPILESLHSCHVRWDNNFAANTHVVRLSGYFPEDDPAQLSCIRQHIQVVRGWVARNVPPPIPSLPGAFTDREEAQAAITDWCAYLDRLAAAKMEQSEGNGGAGSGPEERQSTETPKKKSGRGRKVDKATIRRADFVKPLREKRESYPNIYAAYSKKHPRDVDATEDILRRAFERQYPEVAAKLKEGGATD